MPVHDAGIRYQYIEKRMPATPDAIVNVTERARQLTTPRNATESDGGRLAESASLLGTPLAWHHKPKTNERIARSLTLGTIGNWLRIDIKLLEATSNLMWKE